MAVSEAWTQADEMLRDALESKDPQVLKFAIKQAKGLGVSPEARLLRHLSNWFVRCWWKPRQFS